MTAQTLQDPFALAGTTLEGQYRVERVIGEGGFGVVYKGHHLSFDQPIAIKALKVLADDEAVQQKLLAKFREEAQLLYTLSQSSLHVVRSIAFGGVQTPAGIWAPYMILEWLEGQTLEQDLHDRRGRGLRGRTLEEALALLAPAAEGLSVAHERRVAHRDVKPANFFVVGSGAAGASPNVKVLDFGIAKILQDNDKGGTKSPFSAFTYLYAAPEQLDPRLGATGLATDVYAFALVLTELLTDRRPVDAPDALGILKQTTDPKVRPTPRTKGAQVSDALERVCLQALAVDPKERYPSIPALWAALNEAAHAPRPSSTQAMPSRRAGAGHPSNVASNAASNVASNAASNVASNAASNVASNAASNVASNAASNVGAAPGSWSGSASGAGYPPPDARAPMSVAYMHTAPPAVVHTRPPRPLEDHGIKVAKGLLIALVVGLALALSTCAACLGGIASSAAP